MADTIRSLSALQALLADNTSGDISPQDMRDALVSSYTGEVFAAHQPPPAADWSWVNQGTATVTTQTNGALTFAGAAVGAANLIGYVRSVSDPFTVTARVDGSTVSTSGGYGLVARDSTSSELVVMYAKRGGGLVVEYWTDHDSFSSTPANSGTYESPAYWMQIEDNSTNLIWRVSASGAPGSWIDIFSASRTAFLNNGPDQVGWLFRDHSQPFASTLQSWVES